MKKIIDVFIICILCLTLTACVDEQPEKEIPHNNKPVEETMIIKPRSLTDDQKDILKLFDDEVAFYDLVVDDTVKSYAITLWSYQNNNWKKIAESITNINGVKGNPYRLDMNINGENFDFCLYGSEGTGEACFTQYEELKLDYTLPSISKHLENTQNVEVNKEITLWVKVASADSGVMTISDNFKDTKCTEGYAVTLTLYDEVYVES